MPKRSAPKAPAPYLPPEVCLLIFQFVRDGPEPQTIADVLATKAEQIQPLTSLRLVNHAFADAGLEYLFESVSVKLALEMLEKAETNPAKWNHILKKIHSLSWECPQISGKSSCHCDIPLRFRKDLGKLLERLTKLQTLSVDLSCIHDPIESNPRLDRRAMRWGMLLDLPGPRSTVKRLHCVVPECGRSDINYWQQIFRHSRIGPDLDTLSVRVRIARGDRGSWWRGFRIGALGPLQLSSLKSLVLHGGAISRPLAVLGNPFPMLTTLALENFQMNTININALLAQMSPTIQSILLEKVKLNAGWSPVLQTMLGLSHLSSIHLEDLGYAQASNRSAPWLQELNAVDVRFLAAPMFLRCSAASFKALCRLFRKIKDKQIADGVPQTWTELPNAAPLIDLATKNTWYYDDTFGLVSPGCLYINEKYKDAVNLPWEDIMWV